VVTHLDYYLERDDLPRALAELESGSDTAHPVVWEWVQAARSRLVVEQAVTVAKSRVTSAMKSTLSGQ
jgi:hypothetical protein